MVTTVLEAAAQVKSIRRVVLTSSCKRDFDVMRPQMLTWCAGVTLIPFEWNMNPDSERLYKCKSTRFWLSVYGMRKLMCVS